MSLPWGDVGMGDTRTISTVKEFLSCRAKQLKVEEPNAQKSKPCDVHNRVCLPILRCSTQRRVEAAPYKPIRAGHTPTRSKIKFWSLRQAYSTMSARLVSREPWFEICALSRSRGKWGGSTISWTPACIVDGSKRCFSLFYLVIKSYIPIIMLPFKYHFSTP